MTKRNRAFSLIEILIVLAILGLIASLVLPVVKSNRDKAAYEVSVMNLFQVAKAMEKHYLEKGKYPVFQKWGEVSGSESPLKEYLNDIPEKDGFGRDYRVAESTESDYVFEGFGISGKLGESYPDFQYGPGPKMKTSGSAN